MEAGQGSRYDQGWVGKDAPQSSWDLEAGRPWDYNVLRLAVSTHVSQPSSGRVNLNLNPLQVVFLEGILPGSEAALGYSELSRSPRRLLRYVVISG